MAHESRAVLSRLFDGELDARVLALVTVVERGHDPGHLDTLRIVDRMVVDAVVSEFLHAINLGASAVTV
jgi:hypothetical protein